MDQSVSIAILTANAILLVTFGVWLHVAQREQTARFGHFIGRFRADAVKRVEEVEVAPQPTLIVRLNRFLARRDFVSNTRRDLVRAGLAINPTRFFLLRLGLALVTFLLGDLLTASIPTLPRLVLLVAMAIGGYLLVRPYISWRQRRRVEAFEKPFPDALDIMVGALESGSSLTSAVELVSREMPPPLSTEFARLLRDVGLGRSFDEGFNALHDRVPSEDLGMLVSAVTIQLRVGGNLAEVLKTLAHTVRERIRIKGEIKTLTSQQRISTRIITGLPFFLVVVLFLLNSTYMRHLFDPGLPRFLAAMATVMVLIGNLVIRRLVDIDV